MEPNLIYLDSIYKTCKALEIVKNQTEFSELCGRARSWYSVCKAKNLNPSTEAIISLGMNLSSAQSHIIIDDNIKGFLQKSVASLLTKRLIRS